MILAIMNSHWLYFFLNPLLEGPTRSLQWQDSHQILASCFTNLNAISQFYSRGSHNKLFFNCKLSPILAQWIASKNQITYNVLILPQIQIQVIKATKSALNQSTISNSSFVFKQGHHFVINLFANSCMHYFENKNCTNNFKIQANFRFINCQQLQQSYTIA